MGTGMVSSAKMMIAQEKHKRWSGILANAQRSCTGCIRHMQGGRRLRFIMPIRQQQPEWFPEGFMQRSRYTDHWQTRWGQHHA